MLPGRFHDKVLKNAKKPERTVLFGFCFGMRHLIKTLP